MKKQNAVRTRRIIGAVFVMALLLGIGNELFTTVKLKYKMAQVNQEHKKLKDEALKLKNEVSKLKDDSYIQSYVSGTIFSTEKGTEIYILPKDKKSEAPE